MNLDEAWDATVTREEALQEVRAHGCSTAEFLAEEGDRDEYMGWEVLGWLGW